MFQVSTSLRSSKNSTRFLVDVVRYLEVGVVEEDLPLLASLDGIVRKRKPGLKPWPPSRLPTMSWLCSNRIHVSLSGLSLSLTEKR